MAKYRFEQIAINSTEKKKPVEEDRFTYLGLEHLDSGSLKVTRFGSEVAPIGEKLVMHKGDVLFGKRRAYQKKVAIAPFDGIFSAHGMVLRPREDVIDKSFFPLFISSDYFLDAAIKISVGSLSPTINWRDLKTLEFELPDLATQRKLAETLWSINETMEAYKKLISAISRLPDPVGRACIIPDGLGKSITAVDCSIVRLKSHVLPEFFVAYTMTTLYAAQIGSSVTGSTRKRISRKNLGQVVIPTPDIDQQEQFAAFVRQSDKSKLLISRLKEFILMGYRGHGKM